MRDLSSSQFPSPLPSWRYTADVGATPIPIGMLLLTPKKFQLILSPSRVRLAVRGLCLKEKSLKCLCRKKAHVHNNQMCIHISLAFIHQLYIFLLNTLGKKITSLPNFFFLILTTTQGASNVYPSFIEEYAVYETFQLVNVGIKLGNLESYFLLYIISSHR